MLQLCKHLSRNRARVFNRGEIPREFRINCHLLQEGDSVLMGSAGRGFSIIVECLLQHNADPNITNKAGRTPIMEAARKGHKEVIKVLLRFGADILLTSHEVMSY
jgi:ankyrin repeat protein